MADRKITKLPVLDKASSNDTFVVVDDSESDVKKKTKQISKQNILSSPGPIGERDPDFGKFSILELNYGNPINEFSTDGNLSGNSDTAVPTEKAVKNYADKISVDLKIKNISTSSIVENGDVALVDSSMGDVNICLKPSDNGKIVVKKISSDLNKIKVFVLTSGLIDNKSEKEILWENESIFFLSDGVDFYII